jgi:hypothetical protein
MTPASRKYHNYRNWLRCSLGLEFNSENSKSAYPATVCARGLSTLRLSGFKTVISKVLVYEVVYEASDFVPSAGRRKLNRFQFRCVGD